MAILSKSRSFSCLHAKNTKAHIFKYRYMNKVVMIIQSKNPIYETRYATERKRLVSQFKNHMELFKYLVYIELILTLKFGEMNINVIQSINSYC